MSEPDCIFCKIVAGELPSTRVDEDERTIAFMDINPAVRGHVLVIPREHSRNLLDIAPDDLHACTDTAQRVARRMRGAYDAEGVNLLNSSEPVAWQTVFHFHLHVIPRYHDDPLELPWVPAPGDMDEIRAAGAELADA
jgi:histidine triad (HIT) family protein